MQIIWRYRPHQSDDERSINKPKAFQNTLPGFVLNKVPLGFVSYFSSKVYIYINSDTDRNFS